MISKSDVVVTIIDKVGNKIRRSPKIDYLKAD